MADEIELERTFLLRFFPDGMEKEGKEVFDIYLPSSKDHPTLRIRKSGNNFAITKKEPIKGADISEKLEQTIPLTKEEFAELSTLEGKRVRKIRYAYDYKGRKADIGVFKDKLEGLVLVEFEFNNAKEKDRFKIPDFCLAEVTGEQFLAGGMLCGKGYWQIEKALSKFGYQKIAPKSGI